jgi:hypothetical protein
MVRIGSVHNREWTKRGPDRRVRNGSFHVPERRLGFDRRRPPRDTWHGRYHEFLDRYRGDTDTVAAVLLVFVVLNVADLLLTVRALSMGATELNPVMAWLFALDPTLAALFKLSMWVAIALAVWAARRYRLILETSLFLVAVMTVVLLYHGVVALF